MVLRIFITFLTANINSGGSVNYIFIVRKYIKYKRVFYNKCIPLFIFR